MAFNNIPPNGFPALPDVEDLEAVVKDVNALKLSVSGLTEDVSDLNDNKVNQITIAPFFNSETSYDVGDLVYYNGLSYRCTNAHEGEWDADDFVATTIANELSSLMSGLTNVYGSVYSVESRTIDSTGVVEYVIPYDGFYAVQLQNLNTQAHDLYCTLSVNGTPILTPFLSQYVTYQYDKLSTVIPLKAGAVLHAVGAENDVMLIMQMSAN